jgi:hypothetical protein
VLVSPAVKISVASGFVGTAVFSALVGNPIVGAALGVLLMLVTAAVLTLLEDIPYLIQEEKECTDRRGHAR